MKYAVINTPIGALQIEAEDGCITAVKYIAKYAEKEIQPDDPLLQLAVKQINDYFEGSLKEFTLPVKLNVTPYRKKVLEELMKVPYGRTTTYGRLADLTGNPKASRRVGSAMRTNPVILIVPCHRVLQGSGALGNYSAGGPANKEWLLAHEKQNRG